MVIELIARSPFNLSSVIRSHGWSSLVPYSINEPGDHLANVVRLESGKVVELLMRPQPNGVQVQTDAQLSAADREQVKALLRWTLAMDQDFTEFYALAKKEPKLQHVEGKAQGRLLRSPTLFEDSIKTILTTNTSWAGTKRMVRSLVSQFGDPLPSDPERQAFPTPQQLATTDVETLRSTTRLGYRAPYILELAQQVFSGELDLEALKSNQLATSDLHAQLLAIKGVGGYAAANLLMILGRYDYLPIDSWALKLVSHEWYAGEGIGPAEVEAAFESWEQWKGLAYWNWDWAYLAGS